MKNNFDEQLKNKWEQFHFPVDKQHREEMIRMLNDQQRRRTGLIWWFSGLGTAIGVAAFILFYAGAGQQTSNLSDQRPPSNKQELPQANATADNPAIRLRESTSDGDKPVVLEQHAASIPAIHTVPEAEQFAQLGEENRNNKPQDNSSTLKNEKGANALNKKQTISHPYSADPKTSVEDIHVAQSEKFIRNEFEHGVNEGSALTKRDVVVIHSLFSARIDPLPIDYDRQDKSPTTEIQKRSVLRLFASAGAAYIPGVKSKFDSGHALHAGLGISYNILQRMELTLAGGYLMQKDGFEFEKESVVKQHTFGIRSNFNTLSPDRLHFVYLAAGTQYRLSRNIISLSAGAQYLYGAQGNISVASQDQLTGDSYAVKYTWLNIDGMERFLWNTSISYGYQVTPYLSMHAGARIYFTSLNAEDPELAARGYHWRGNFAPASPFFTVQYQLYEKRK